MSLLTDTQWKTKYDSDEISLVSEFYVPALETAVRYDRTTGYFSGRVLTLAARGVEGLIRNHGRMRLIVGCTLEQVEVEAILKGAALRSTVEARLMKNPLTAESPVEGAALEFVAWMVARGLLEVKVAVPCDAQRRPRAAPTVFHEKAGVVEDKTGDRLAFNGSVNETPQGWSGNWESFHVFTSWTGPDGAKRVADEEESFARLWNDKARHSLILDVPTAVREDLLRFLPLDDARPRRLDAEPAPDAAPVVPEAMPPSLDVEPELSDVRRLAWGIVRHAPALAGGGERVGEATANVEPWPHQVRAFERLYSTWPPRLLIADEVGLGKTIEAGLLLRQAVLAGRARRVLVLAPSAVLKQWQLELREKFNLHWPIYTGSHLVWPASPGRVGPREEKVGRNEWHLQPFVLVSSQMMRRADRRGELIEAASGWDLLVLDEAHHARRKGGGQTRDRKPNQLLGLMHALREKAAGLILMTATPMQVDPVEVWDLLNLLGLPPKWTEFAFKDFFEKLGGSNPSHEDFEFLASLFRASESHFGPVPAADAARHAQGLSKLALSTTLEALRDQAQTVRKQLSTERRKAALRVMRAASPVGRLISRHTRELLRRYYKAGKITTRIADRDVHDDFIDLSPAEREVYDLVEDYISTTYNQAAAGEKNAVGFVMTIYRRRLASSFYALAQTLSDRQQALTDPSRLRPTDDDLPDDEAADEQLDADEMTALEREALLLEESSDLTQLLLKVKRLPDDTKAGRLIHHLRDLQTGGYAQVLVFTQYTDTMDFLRERLAAQGFNLLCFSGRGGERLAGGLWSTVSRDDVKRMFREGQAEILLCTDAAAEGLNFQFCGALVNYDMPWNPMRVEQRIGRIDRLGQKFERIRIVNLHYNDTVEADVYRALRTRIALFVSFVGPLQPILATLSREIQRVTLVKQNERQRTADALVAQVTAAPAAGFDLDAVIDADLDEPVRAPASYNLRDLGALLKRKDLLPPGIEITPLNEAHGEFRYLAPGFPAAIAVTTDAKYFDEHAGSLELWSPGSPIFPVPDEVCEMEDVTSSSRRLREITG